MATEQFEVGPKTSAHTRPGTGFSPESGPGRDQSQNRSGTGPGTGPNTWDWSRDQSQDRSQDRFWLTIFSAEPGSQDQSQDRSQDWSRSPDRSTGPENPLFVRSTIIGSNHFQLHPTPVPSAGGWDGRVGGFLAEKQF